MGLFEQKIAAASSSNGKAPSSISLPGSASWVAGSLHDSGNVQLTASSDGSTTENWSFSSVSHAYASAAFAPFDFSRACTFTDKSSKQHVVTGPNCLQGIPWFFPVAVLGTALSGQVTVVDETSTTDSSHGLEKLKYTLNTPTTAQPDPSVQDQLVSLQKATAVTIYYDVKTDLPSRLVYYEASDSDQSRGLEVSVDFSNYSAESSFMIPHHIQRYVQRTLQADITITSVSIQ